MTFKSTFQPHCRFCGKPIAKKTKGAWFGRLTPSPTGDWREKPRSIEEVRQLTGKEVASIRWNDKTDHPDNFIFAATLWDGGSYVDEYFCGPGHAAKLGELLAEAGHCTAAYRSAVK